jgi:hypothetical protein
MKISSLFDLRVAKSKGNEDYDPGTIPYVSSTILNNGIIKYVEPYADDRLFNGNVICISGLGFATLQLSQFLPKGNGGDSATILVPLENMTSTELIYYTATFNLLHNWRFSFGRKCSKNRIKDLDLIPYLEYNQEFTEDFNDFMGLFTNQVEHFKDIVINENTISLDQQN